MRWGQEANFYIWNTGSDGYLILYVCQRAGKFVREIKVTPFARTFCVPLIALLLLKLRRLLELNLTLIVTLNM